MIDIHIDIAILTDMSVNFTGSSVEFTNNL